MNMKTLKGRYTPKNPQKYKGDPTKIIYRSSWELMMMKYFDGNPYVLEWSSEELCIPYISPIDGRQHLYYPDFKIKMKDKNGTIRTKVIEIKPKKQTIPPEKKSRITKKYIHEVATYGINSAKWKYAKEYCEDRKWEFLVFTEKEIGLI